MRPKLEPEIDSWVAGYLAGQGTFTLTLNRSYPVVRLMIRTSKDKEALEIIAAWCGGSIQKMTRNGQPAHSVQLQGERLHSYMKKLWPYLTEARKREYADLRHKVHARQAERNQGLPPAQS